MISALFCRKDSVYKLLGLDTWDEHRNAMLWPGGNPVICHPPCRLWGRLRQFSIAPPEEKQCAIFSVECVRNYGGVIEHPECSKLWNEMGLPKPGDTTDCFGGYSISLDQFDFGHRARKRTWLYIVGGAVPAYKTRTDKPTHCIRPTKKYPRLPSVTKPEREATPIDFARFLIRIAESAK